MRALLLSSVWRLSSPLRISRTPSPSSGPAWRLHPVTTDMVALDKILDLWCNNQRLPTFHTRLTLGSTLHDSGIACQLAQRCRTLMARLSSHSRRYIALFHQPYPPKSTQRLSTFDWQRRPTSGSLTVRPPPYGNGVVCWGPHSLSLPTSGSLTVRPPPYGNGVVCWGTGLLHDRQTASIWQRRLGLFSPALRRR